MVSNPKQATVSNFVTTLSIEAIENQYEPITNIQLKTKHKHIYQIVWLSLKRPSPCVSYHCFMPSLMLSL